MESCHGRPVSYARNPLGYACDLAICVENQDPVITAEVTQSALKLIENWCIDQMLSVNPKKAESMLVTIKVKIPSPKTFNDQIHYKTTVKYLGVCIDRRLTGHSILVKRSRSFWYSLDV